MRIPPNIRFSKRGPNPDVRLALRVLKLREKGLTFSAIGKRIDRSKQTAHKHYLDALRITSVLEACG